MAFRLVYHPAVHTDDLPSINQDLQRRMVHAIEQRLATAPTSYGEPLRYHLKGFWKLRVGDYRVIYRMIGEKVLVVAIGYCNTIYALTPRRLVWRP